MTINKLASVLTMTCGAMALLANHARAQAPAVAFSYVTNSSSYYGAMPGSTVPVTIYLAETTNGNPDYISANGGLTAAGAAVNFSSVSGGISGTTATSTFASGSYTPASPFGLPNSDSAKYFANTTHLTGDQDAVEFMMTTQTPVNPTNNLIPLGTLNITVGTGTTTFSLTSINNDTIAGGGGNGGDGYTTTLKPAPFGSDLDATENSAYTGADAAPGYTFTVAPFPLAAVPEPASAGAGLVVLAGQLLRRRSR